MNEIPTTEHLYALIMADFQNRMGTSLPNWGKYFIRVFAMVNAHLFYLFYVRMFFVYKNILPDTADSVANGGSLERYGLLYLQRLPYNATQSVYEIQGVGITGSTIPSGRTFTTQRNTVNYINDSAFVFAPGVDSFNIRSLTSGTATRLLPGDQVNISSPVTGVENTFFVVSEVTEPTDSEPLESYRQKTITAMRYRSRGGAATDYRFWSIQVIGVRNAYPYTGVPLPNVNLFIESETNDGVPSLALLSDVEAYVETKREMGVYINYLACTQVVIQLYIQGALSLTIADKQQIFTALKAYLYNKRPFIQAIDGSYRNDTININEIIAVIQSVKPSLFLGNIDMTVNGSSHVNYMLDLGNIPFLDEIFYT